MQPDFALLALLKRFLTQRWLIAAFCLVSAGGGLLAIRPSISPITAKAEDVKTEVANPAIAAKLSFAPLVKAVRPAVVNVFASKKLAKSRHPLFDDPVFRQFFGDSLGDDASQQTQSLGSGVIVSPKGLVVTNQHVIEGMDAVRVVLSDRREFDATIVLRDPRSDLAVLKLNGGSDFPTLPLGDSDKLEVGDFVLAIGNPFGVGQSVTQGIVSALARSQIGLNDYNYYIQTDAAINPGNSGGALVDLSGRLVGINSAIYSRSGGSQGIGFAVPAVMVKLVLAAAETGQTRVRRPWFGASVQSVARELADSLGLAKPSGALVGQIMPGSPAEKSGLARGDVIIGLDDALIEDAEAFGFRLGTHALGGTARLAVLRKGAPITLIVSLIAAPEIPPRETQTLSGANPFAGATVENYSPAVGEETGLQLTAPSVIVRQIRDGSVAQEIGLQKNDILLALNGVKISSVRDMQRLVSSHPDYWKLTIQRGNQQLTTVIGE